MIEYLLEFPKGSLQISLLIISEFKKINFRLFPPKLSENHFLMISREMEAN